MGTQRTFVSLLFVAALAGSAGSILPACGSYMAADAGSGGNDATGGADGGVGGNGVGGSSGGALATGGTLGSGGAPAGTGGSECGPCPGAACQPALTLQVSSDSAAGQVNLHGLTAESEDLTVTCELWDGCSGSCGSQYLLADGHYTVTLSAPAAEPVTVEFDIVNPQDCGCCGCCPGSHFEQIVMVPDPASESPNDCCADLETDSANCGICGHTCSDTETCVDGDCTAPP